MTSRLIGFALVDLQLLMFKFCGFTGVSKIKFFNFSGTERVKSGISTRIKAFFKIFYLKVCPNVLKEKTFIYCNHRKKLVYQCEFQGYRKAIGKECFKLLKTARCQIFYLFKTSQHLDGDYLLLDNLSFYENGKEKLFITNNIITS